MAACVSILSYHSPETQPPWSRQQPGGSRQVGGPRALPENPGSQASCCFHSSLESSPWLPRLCREAGVLSASGVCLPGRRAVLDSSARSGRGGSWGRKGPRPVPGAHQTSPSWPKQYWEPPTVLAVATPYDPVWAHLHWLVNELVTSGRGKVALA